MSVSLLISSFYLISGTKGDLNVWYISGKNCSSLILVANLLLKWLSRTPQLCGAHFSEAAFPVCVCVVLVAQLCLTLGGPLDSSPPGSSVHGILQARILDRVAISYSRQSSQPRDSGSCIGRQILYHWATWEALGFPRFLHHFKTGPHPQSASPGRTPGEFGKAIPSHTELVGSQSSHCRLTMGDPF